MGPKFQPIPLYTPCRYLMASSGLAWAKADPVNSKVHAKNNNMATRRFMLPPEIETETILASPLPGPRQRAREREGRSLSRIRSKSRLFVEPMVSGAIMGDLAGIDVSAVRREGSQKPLLEEIKALQDQRNSVVHRGAKATDEEAHHALHVASAVFSQVFIHLLAALRLQILQGGAHAKG